MRFLQIVALLELTCFATADPLRWAKRNWPKNRSPIDRPHDLPKPMDARTKRSVMPEVKHHRRAGATLIPQNSNTTRFAVDGTALPEVNFDAGESYAGLMPISDKPNEDRQLYFWFWPTDNPDGKDEITIWLNGGPGCSSLEGILQENGPFVWQYGTFKPVRNPWTWVRLTNMLWVEQPVGTGFSQGDSTVNTNEEMVAAEFLGFFKEWVDTFGLHYKKIYITGESYAGQYVPYIANAMLDQENKEYYDMKGIMIYDPVLNYDIIQTQMVALPFAQFHGNLFNMNYTFEQEMIANDQSCGYADFRNSWYTFPPNGPMPTPARMEYPKGHPCRVFDHIFHAAIRFNPCFDIYQVATTCPLLWDVLGFPGSIPYYVPGAEPVYFAREDVQKAINAPVGPWAECSAHVLDEDTSLPSGLSVLPSVIERSERVIIGHGQLDMVLIPQGSLWAIQNMTWRGTQGFQVEPKTPFYVPYHKGGKKSTRAGAGVFGKTHTERGLTWVETYLTGHMGPQYAPSAAFRQMEYLLGRIPNLHTFDGEFTVPFPWPH